VILGKDQVVGCFLRLAKR